MTYFEYADPEHVKRERRKGQELRKSSWWKQQLGKGVCYHCEGRFPKESLTMDHLVPIARGGRSTKQNCVVSCKECNSKKGLHLPVEVTLQEMEARGEISNAQPSDDDDEGEE